MKITAMTRMRHQVRRMIQQGAPDYGDRALPLQAAEALTGVGFEVFTHVSKGTGHGIAPDGLGLALQFMIEKFGKAAA